MKRAIYIGKQVVGDLDNSLLSFGQTGSVIECEHAGVSIFKFLTDGSVQPWYLEKQDVYLPEI